MDKSILFHCIFSPEHFKVQSEGLTLLDDEEFYEKQCGKNEKIELSA